MAVPRELTSVGAVRDAVAGDALLRWAAGTGAAGVRVFRLGAAAAVAAPALSGRDRLALAGPHQEAAELVGAVLPQLGPTYRPVGDEAMVRRVVEQVPGLELVDSFGWMQTSALTDGGDGAVWLTASDEDDVEALLDAAFPGAYARPGRHGVRRWAGARDGAGTLMACAADAWSAPCVGFLAGVATAERARGRGIGAAVCGLVLDALVAEHGTAALMVDGGNTAAVRLYRRLGMTWRPFAAARVVGG